MTPSSLKIRMGLSQNTGTSFISERAITTCLWRAFCSADFGGQSKRIPRKLTLPGHSSNSTTSTNIKRKLPRQKNTLSLTNCSSLRLTQSKRRRNPKLYSSQNSQLKLEPSRLHSRRTIRRYLLLLIKNTTMIFWRKHRILKNYWNFRIDWGILRKIFSASAWETCMESECITTWSLTSSLAIRRLCSTTWSNTMTCRIRTCLKLSRGHSTSSTAPLIPNTKSFAKSLASLPRKS